MQQRLRYFALTMVVFLLPSILILGQTCSAFLANNVTDWQNNCPNIELGFACYGSGNVIADYENNGLFGTTTSVLFTRPSDQVPLIGFARTYMLKSLATSNTNSSAKLDVSAGLPVQLPMNQNRATFILMGSARVESGSNINTALVLLSNPEAFAVQDSTLYTSPDTLNYMIAPQALTTLSGTQDVQADGRSPDGLWIRIAHQYTTEFGTQRATAWLRRETVVSGDYNILPVIAPDTYTPFQKAYTTGDVHNNDCVNMPSGLMVASAQGLETDLMINDVPMRVSGEIFIDNTTKNGMRVAVLNGTVILWSNQMGQQVLTGGQAIEICLSEAQNLGVDGIANDRSAVIGCTNNTTI